MTNISDLFSAERFDEMIRDGYVTVREHPIGELFIANYTAQTQYEYLWNEVTSICRGLIYDTKGNVVARPFAKFLNWDDSGAPKPPVGPMIRMPKMDGSLGILYNYVPDSVREHGVFDTGYCGIATRGSFESEQAKWASQFLTDAWYKDRSVVGELTSLALSGYTPLFEIIYPENRIVVDYGGDRKSVV